jgi:hypothetical protein
VFMSFVKVLSGIV